MISPLLRPLIAYVLLLSLFVASRCTVVNTRVIDIDGEIVQVGGAVANVGGSVSGLVYSFINALEG